MDLGSCFGFLVKGEERASSEGMYKTPVGSSLRQGTFVSVDDSSAGYLKVAPANSLGEHRRIGFLLQHLGWNQDIYSQDEGSLDTLAKGVTRADRYSVLYYGKGVKFWVKNRDAVTRPDGRVVSAVNAVVLAGIDVGEAIEWNGTRWASSTTGAHDAARVTKVTSDGLEAVLL